jgi:hypothetical protein
MPADEGWDEDAPTATSLDAAEPTQANSPDPSPQSITNPMVPMEDRPRAPAPAPQTAPMPDRPPPAARDLRAPAAAAPVLASAMREEVWAIVRAAVDSATAPLLARQKELEARVERAEREVKARSVQTAPVAQAPAGASAASRLAAIAPPPATLAAAQQEPFRIEDAPTVNTLPEPRPRAPSVPVVLGSLPPQGSPQGYGVTVSTIPRPSLDLDNVTLDPHDFAGFDGGRRKKLVVRLIVVVILLGVAAVVISTLLSYSGPS